MKGSGTYSFVEYGYKVHISYNTVMDRLRILKSLSTAAWYSEICIYGSRFYGSSSARAALLTTRAAILKEVVCPKVGDIDNSVLLC